MSRHQEHLAYGLQENEEKMKFWPFKYTMVMVGTKTSGFVGKGSMSFLETMNFENGFYKPIKDIQ